MQQKKLTPRAAIACRVVGDDIMIARKKRRLAQKDLAAMMGVAISTVQRLERGDPGISLRVLTMAFIALGTLDRFTAVLTDATDDIGLVRDRAELPQRIRKRRVGDGLTQPQTQIGGASEHLKGLAL